MTPIQKSRREFLKKSVVVAAAGGAAPYFSWSQRAFANASANDRPKIGCIGLNGQGIGDAHEHAEFGDIVAVCDVDSRHADRAKHDPQIGQGQADAYKDYRKVLGRKDIDVVSIATPDHWHVKIAIEALQAGKHVFCEKPLTLTLEENQLIRNACKKYSNKVFIVGTQRRSQANLFVRAVNMVQKGLLGEIRKIVVGVNGCPTGGPFPKIAPPAELDWDMWLGQASSVDYIEQRGHYNFRWWYEYSGGKFTDWGAHFVDTATWAIQQDQEGMGPIEIDGADAKHPVPFKDGYPTVDNCYNTSPDFAVKCKFANGIEMNVTSRGDAGILFEGAKGRIFVDMGRITGKPIEQKWDEGKYGPDDLVRLYKGRPF
jgi:predicted dehydrogenase